MAPNERSVAPKESFPFLDLPLDIRLMVYERLPRTTRHTKLVTYISHAEGSPESSVTLITRTTSTAILVTCHTIYNEAKPIIDRTVRTWILEGGIKIVTSTEYAIIHGLEIIMLTALDKFDALVAKGEIVDSNLKQNNDYYYEHKYLALQSVIEDEMICYDPLDSDYVREAVLESIKTLAYHPYTDEENQIECMFNSFTKNIASVVAFIENTLRCLLHERTYGTFSSTDRMLLQIALRQRYDDLGHMNADRVMTVLDDFEPIGSEFALRNFKIGIIGWLSPKALLSANTLPSLDRNVIDAALQKLQSGSQRYVNFQSVAEPSYWEMQWLE